MYFAEFEVLSDGLGCFAASGWVALMMRQPCWMHSSLSLSLLIGLCIPSNNTIFIKSVSERLAANEPHLTLEFLEECIQGFRNSNIEMKHLCLEYMTPWLPNLTRWHLADALLDNFYRFCSFECRFLWNVMPLPCVQYFDVLLTSGAGIFRFELIELALFFQILSSCGWK